MKTLIALCLSVFFSQFSANAQLPRPTAASLAAQVRADQWKKQVYCDGGAVEIDRADGMDVQQLVIRDQAAVAYLNGVYLKQNTTSTPLVNAKGEMIIPFYESQHWDGSSTRIEFSSDDYNRATGHDGQFFGADVNINYELRVSIFTDGAWSYQLANWVFKKDCGIYSY